MANGKTSKVEAQVSEVAKSDALVSQAAPDSQGELGLRGKNVLVGVGGGIAAYKSVLLVRELQRAGARCKVVLSPAAQHFVGATTFAGIVGEPPTVDLWDPRYAGEVHVELGAWADAVVVAPATMNLLARCAAGMANDALLATLACTDAPVFFVPAMHTKMWSQGSTQRNVAQLRADGFVFLGPEVGALASGEVGTGRLREPHDVVADLSAFFGQSETLKGRRIVISAGPTYEDLDPVRYLGNRSTGTMGFALAAQARLRGAEVHLVAGPTALATPPGVHRHDVRSAVEMAEVVLGLSEGADGVIMAAAVADYRPAETTPQKRKKAPGPLTLELVRNPDILAELGARRGNGASPVLIGFALETEKLLENARGKLERKGADLIVANEAKDGFGGATNRVTLVGPDSAEALGILPKSAVAGCILDRLYSLLQR